MPSAIDVPNTRQNIASQSNQHRNPPAPPINESMVRELLSVNLPKTFRRPINPLERSHKSRHQTRRPRSRSSSSASSANSATLSDHGEHSGPGRQRRSRPPRISTRASSSSSRSSRSSSAPPPGASDEDHAFYARLVKVGGGAPDDEPVALARCCHTVRGMLQLLEEAQVCKEDGKGEESTGFFWLDLHGVPPPRLRDRAALHNADSDDAPLKELWAALGLQLSTVKTLETVRKQRQAHTRPDRTLLDDVYEEEMIDLTSPSDRVLHVERLRAREDDASADEHGNNPHQHERSQFRPGKKATGQRTSCGSVAGSTHYVVLELATLLTPIQASSAMSEEAWESALLPRTSLPNEYVNEPLNEFITKENFERTVLSLSAATAAAHRHAAPASSTDMHEVTKVSQHSQEPTTVPVITSTYVVCFPTGCVTWCPASTLGLTSAGRRSLRSAASANGQQRERTVPHVFDKNDGAGGISHHAPFGDDDKGVEVWCVKAWGQLQATVLGRMRYMAQLGRCATATTTSHTWLSGALSEIAAPSRSALAEPVLRTSTFVPLLFSAVCHAYLPNMAIVLGEVDAIDSMLPLIELDSESDQTDTIRRVLQLRRRLALHRRLLFQKICLLEALDRPVIHTAARFIRTHKAPTWAKHNANPRVAAKKNKTAVLRSASNDGGNRLGSIDMDRPGADAGAATVRHPLSSDQYYKGLNAKRSEHGTLPRGDSISFIVPQSTLAASSTAPPQMAPPPSLAAVYKSVMSVMHNLEVARTVLGNATLIYTSKVNFSNSRTSETADYFALMCQYMLLVVLPLNIVASHWGMNCPVPFASIENTNPFWGIVGIIALIGVVGAVVPLYAFKTRRIHLIW
ncbi:hypothetical protein JKF63_03935 [Porcisia hertigi]|uniref:Uncharacterized protein n=1 Tax=Porcisia hertigi TaxID=2761500 RepID=A0A836HRE1_9TRYP|nr:hypothetical protein JKF63_03935 [Porcisia hertigi]